MKLRYSMPRLTIVALYLAQICASFFTTSAAAARETAYGTQQLISLDSGRPGIMLTVNGEGPFLFMIDTATSNTVLTKALASRLHVPKLPGAEFDVVTASGAVRSHFYHVDEMTMAGVTVEGVRVVVFDLPVQFGIMGALGADFLSNFTVDLDLPRHAVTLYPQGAEFPDAGLTRLRGTLNAHGFIILPARVSNIFAAAAFDSGAELTVANSRLAAYARSVGMMTVERATEHKVTDAAHLKRYAASHDFERITLGPTTWLGPSVMISDMRVFDQIGIGNQPAIFIGMDLMEGRRVVIDYAGASLWLTR
jgi:hypothetical protein